MQYIPGDLNLILTAPHGGYSDLGGSIPEREDGCPDPDATGPEDPDDPEYDACLWTRDQSCVVEG